MFDNLRERKVERALCSQLLRIRTSIGANIEEAIGGSSRRDFIHKLEIAYMEARETRYWLRLLHEANLPEGKLADSFLMDCNEIQKYYQQSLIHRSRLPILNYKLLILNYK